MTFKTALLAGAAAATLGLAAQADAQTLRYAFQGDVNSADPYGVNETFTLGTMGNIYEGLVKRTPDLTIVPGLATSWEIVEPTRWRFQLREGVTFHNGNAFNADDVVFSYQRILSQPSDLKTRVGSVEDIVKVDEFTVDVITTEPNPILISDWDTFYIFDKEWSEENNTTEAVDETAQTENFANRNANGTGPFVLVSREPERLVAERNPNYWGEVPGNIQRVEFQQIASAPTRIAALLSGEMDMVYPVPLQDMERINQDEDTAVLSGPELRTIYIGMDQHRDELLYSNIEGENPLKDRRVRMALYQSINVDAIQQIVMRGQSTPAASMVAPGIIGFPEDLERYPYDLEAAQALLAEAGYPDGFEIQLDCPNNRYVNDEAICQALVGMWGQLGLDVTLLAQDKNLFFTKIADQGGYDFSLYLLGWTPGSFDSHNPLYNLVSTRSTEGAGQFNYGDYSNARIDELTTLIQSETDLEQRDAMIQEAWQILHDEVGYLPLHQQAVAWGIRSNIELEQRPDNVFAWSYVVKHEE